jgi:hypothetical protein
MGTYLNALLLYKLVTGRSPLQAPKFQVTDDNSRLHADMRKNPEEWSSSDLWQRRTWPKWSLPEVDDELDGRLRMWAHSVLPHPVRISSVSKMPHSHEMSKQMHRNLAIQRNVEVGPCIALPKAKSNGGAQMEKKPQASAYTTQPGLHFQASKVDGHIPHHECTLFPKTPCRPVLIDISKRHEMSRNDLLIEVIV